MLKYAIFLSCIIAQQQQVFIHIHLAFKIHRLRLYELFHLLSKDFCDVPLSAPPPKQNKPVLQYHNNNSLYRSINKCMSLYVLKTKISVVNMKCLGLNVK